MMAVSGNPMLLVISIVIALYLVMSIAAFSAYASDKKKAKQGAWRIPEKVLLLLGFLGGGAGALLAMKFLRHKTKHWYFWTVNWAGFVWQAAALALLVLRAMNLL